MNLNIVDSIRLFCKNNQTVGLQIKDLYNKYIPTASVVVGTKGYAYCTFKQFELVLLELNKRVIINLKKTCIEFVEQQGDAYEKFIEKNEFITKDLWNLLISEEKLIKEQTDVKLLENYFGYVAKVCPPRSAQILQELILARILKLSGEKPAHLKLESCPEKPLQIKDSDLAKECFNQALKVPEETPRKVSTMGWRRANKVFKIQPKIEESPIKSDVSIPHHKVELEPTIKHQKATQQKVPVKAVSKSQSFKEKMPLNWDNMKFSDRLEFAKNIADKEFKSYVLAKDPKVKSYLDCQKKNPQASPMKLYINLFSFPANRVSPETKAIVKDLIKALNNLGRGRLQYVEILDPPTIEIREVR